MGNEEIELFVISKLSWILAKRACCLAQNPRRKYAYVSGELHAFLGKWYLLQVMNSEKKKGIALMNDRLCLFVRPDGSAKLRAEILMEWYRKMLDAQLPALVSKWASRLDVCVQEVRIKNMRTRWGSCNIRAKRIWLNLQLAKKPLECLEYVMVHELIHLLEPSHGPRFQFLMDQYLPEWKKYGELLKFE